MRFATAPGGVRIAYATEGEGRALVFVRGWITHLELMWAQPSIRRFFAPLSARMRIIRFDDRANGLSDREVGQVDLPGLVEDIEAVVDALKLESFTLWGSCFGGPPAIAFASKHPQRVERLILDGTFARGSDIASPEQRDRFLDLVSTVGSQPYAVHAALSYLTDPEPDVSHHARIRRGRQSVDPDRLRELYELAYRMDVSDLARKLEMPALVLHRRRTRSIPFDAGRRLAATIPASEFIGLEGEAHNLWEERPQEALDAIASFIGLDLPAPVSRVRQRPVTVLLTDIVDSTAVMEKLGDERARELFSNHDRSVRSALTANRGLEVKHTGDGILAAFESVADALTCAIDIQQTLRSVTIEDNKFDVRVGMTTGEPLPAGGDLYGMAVNVAARVCGEASGGQIVVTNVVRELAIGKNFTFRSVGERRLKGIRQPTLLWELDWRS